MDDRRLLVRRVARRLGGEAAGRIVSNALLGLLVFVCLAILLDKLIFLGAPVVYVLAAATVLCAAGAVLLSVRRWPSDREAALAVDERLRLKERISTSLAVEGDASAMARAVVQDAASYARAVSVAQSFPLRVPVSFWWAMLAGAVALAILGVMPQLDLLARKHKLELARQEREAVREQAQDMRRELEQLRKSAAARRLDDHFDKMEAVVREMEKGELTRSETLAKLTELGESLNQARENVAKDNKLAKALANRTEFEQTKNLADALKKGDFDAAKDETRKLAQDAKSGKLSQEEKDKLKKELCKLGELAGPNSELGQALAQFGELLDRQGADALAQSLAKIELTLDDLQKLQEELGVLSACQGMCKGCQGGLRGALVTHDLTGIYNTGDNRTPGPGMGGPGIGVGGIAPVQEEQVDFEITGVKGQIREGRMVGSFFVDGEQLRGEAKAEYSQTVEAARAEAAEALDRERIPRVYEDYVREYFHRMKTD
ncbi:MAG: hypothetical protein V2A58_04155 [Planctomycetota bacterium]